MLCGGQGPIPLPPKGKNNPRGGWKQETIKGSMDYDRLIGIELAEFSFNLPPPPPLYKVRCLDGQYEQFVPRLRRETLDEGIGLSVGTYCWTFHHSADKLRSCPSYNRRRGRNNCVRNLITYGM